MFAVLVTLMFFAFWWVIGLAGLHVLRADLRELRVVLTAPIFGTALTLLPLFILSNFGVPMRLGGPPVVVALLVAGIGVVAVRRPRVTLTVLPVLLLCLVDLGLVGRPMFELGLRWIANANGDMGYYVLSATELINHGLRTAVDVRALAQNRDYPTFSQALNLSGLRPGAQITLAGFAAVWNRHPVDLYMPMSLATNMSAVCAVGGLTMQATKRWWAAVTAAALIVTSPLWGYGVLQQLWPQVWGVGLAVALFAWLMRPEVHKRRVPLLPDLFVIAVLIAALFIVYFEVAVSLLAAYALYVLLLVIRREVSVRALALLWGAPAVALVAITNVWLPRAIGYLHMVLAFGTGGGAKGLPLFGYAVVPTALVGVAGIGQIYAAPGDAYMSSLIAVAALLLLGALAASIITAARGAAAGVVVLGDVVVGALLARNNNEFGLFKLYMYAQPFVASTLAIWLFSLRTRRNAMLSAVVLVAVAGVQVATLTSYVDKSFNPIDLPHASASDVLPKFRQTLRDATKPVVTATDNFALIELEGAVADRRQLYFLSRNLFNQRWRTRTLVIQSPAHAVKLRFQENRAAARVLHDGSCLLSIPTGSEVAINRRTLPEGSPSFEVLDCSTLSGQLALITSSLGQPATLPLYRRRVSFWQLEPDSALPGRTFSGFGRYALFQILGPTPDHVRVVLDLTTSPISDRLPPAAVAGDGRVDFPLTGSGSARVVSPPIQPTLIDGNAYVVLDMGRKAFLRPSPRPGLTGLWGKSVPVDPRPLTSYVRDVSLISDAAYGKLRPPAGIRRFPAQLADANLEYSGIYEDGWLSGDSYVILPRGGGRVLAVQGDLLPLPHQRLELLVNGAPVATKLVTGGTLDWRIPLLSSRRPRRIELRWARTRRISPGDSRRAAARLTFLGFSPTPSAIAHFPSDLHTGVTYSGIYDDGWLAPVSSATLAGGRTGRLVIRAEVPEREGQRLVVRVDGRQVAARAVGPGSLVLRIPIAASSGPRRVELAWARTEKLTPPDTRHAAARLTLLEIEPTRKS